MVQAVCSGTDGPVVCMADEGCTFLPRIELNIIQTSANGVKGHLISTFEYVKIGFPIVQHNSVATDISAVFTCSE